MSAGQDEERSHLEGRRDVDYADPRLTPVDGPSLAAHDGDERPEECDWRTRGVCRDADPELFFPTASSGPAWEAQTRAAKALCRGCPVREQCLSLAMKRLPFGIAGGTTEQERRALRRPSVGGGRRGSRARRASQVRDRALEGRRLLSLGLSPRSVASRLGVSVRTAERWAAAARREAASGAEAAS